MPPPGKYDELRQTEQQPETASQANATMATPPQVEPTRPTDHPASGRVWTGMGDLASEQGAANKWVKQNYGERQEAAAAPTQQENAQEIREIVEAAKAREDAARARERERDSGR